MNTNHPKPIIIIEDVDETEEKNDSDDPFRTENERANDEEEEKDDFDVNDILMPPRYSTGNSSAKRSVTLEIPTDAFRRPRPSSVSRNSIELFLNSFPKSETAYANEEIMNVVTDIMKSDIGISSEMTLIEKIKQILQSNKFHLFMIALVALDCVCVVVQVILDIIHSKKRSIKTLENVVELFSCFILSLFIVEIVFKAFLLTKHFFKSKLELFDAAIVIASFSLEIVSIVKHDQIHAVEAAVNTFRFWRVVRIANGVILTIERRVYHKLSKLKEDIKGLLEENTQLESENKVVIVENKNIKTQLVERLDELDILKQKLRDVAQENKKLKIELTDKGSQIEKLDLSFKLKLRDIECEHLTYKLEMERKLADSKKDN